MVHQGSETDTSTVLVVTREPDEQPVQQPPNVDDKFLRARAHIEACSFKFDSPDGLIALGALFKDALERGDARSVAELSIELSPQRVSELRSHAKILVDKAIRDGYEVEKRKHIEGVWFEAIDWGIEKQLTDQSAMLSKEIDRVFDDLGLEMRRTRSFWRHLLVIATAMMICIVILSVLNWMDPLMAETVREIWSNIKKS